MRYLVKFERDGQTIYGIAETHAADAAKLQKKGLVLVSDAVLPTSYHVQESLLIDIPVEMGRWDPETHDFVGQDEYHEYVKGEFRKAQEISAKVPPGVRAGKLFSIGVGDGSAHYVITKVTKTRATVEWRGFCMDRWTDHHFGWGRTVAIADVERYVKFEEGLRSLFGRKAAS